MNRGAQAWLALGWVGFALLPWHLVRRRAGSSWLVGFADRRAAQRRRPRARPDAHGGSRRSSLPLLLATLAALVTRIATEQAARWLIAAGIARPRADRRAGLRDRAARLELGVPRRAVRRAGTEPGRHGLRRRADRGRLPDAALLRPRRARLVPRRRLRGRRDRHRRRADRSSSCSSRSSTILTSALQDNAGAFALGEFVAKFFDRSIWGLDCVTSNLRCGVAWNTLFLAVLVGVGTTALGLAFALIATRTGMRFKGALRVLTILPIITPPFVIGLALILLFGRSGTVTALLSNWFDIPRSRWIYGLPGIFIAQIAGLHADRLPGADRRRAGHQPVARGSRADHARAALDRVRDGLAAADPARASPMRSCSASSRAWRISAIRWCSAAISRCCRPRSSSPWSAPRMTSRAPPCSRSCCSPSRSARSVLQHVWLGKRVYTTVTGKGDAGIPLAAAAAHRLALLRDRDPVGDLHLRGLRHDPRRRLREVDGARPHADAASTISPASASR